MECNKTHRWESLKRWFLHPKSRTQEIHFTPLPLMLQRIFFVEKRDLWLSETSGTLIHKHNPSDNQLMGALWEGFDP
jgi:hypothetical protein